MASLFDSVTVEREWLEARVRHWPGATLSHGLTAAHSVYWNTRGEAYFENTSYIVHSAQARYGYVIGTQGPAHGVRTDGPAWLEPKDHVEGVGAGERMEPQSLYQDQLKRRLGR